MKDYQFRALMKHLTIIIALLALNAGLLLGGAGR